jgi:sulfur relay protein TusB/DsrH
MTLHQVMASAPHILKQLSLVAGSEDQVIFLGDGCYQISRWSLPTPAFAMEEDMRIRGLHSIDIKLITANEWVAMTLNSTNVMTWK